MLLVLGHDCASGEITGAVDRHQQSIPVDPVLGDVIPRLRTVGIGVWALQLCRVEHESIPGEAEVVEQPDDVIEHVLNVRLDAVPELPNRTEHERLIAESTDETPEHRVKALLEFPELEFLITLFG